MQLQRFLLPARNLLGMLKGFAQTAQASMRSAGTRTARYEMAAIALGVLVNPLAAPAPLIDTGNAPDSGCGSLAAQMASRERSRTRTDNSSSMSTGLIR
jgi:hypothetical protein